MTANEAHDLRAAGCAALLELMDAARKLAEDTHYGAIPPTSIGGLIEVVERLDILLAELKPEPAHVWRDSTWAEVAKFGPGTRVRLGGVEAVVDMATSTTWHVDPNSPAKYPRPLERTLVKVKLVGRVQTYDFPPGNVVEVQDVNWPTVTDADWAAAAMAAQGERAIRVLAEALGARPMPVARTTDDR